jgi:RNA polymerase sigma-70 factor (ECF subfamily)
MVMGDDHLRTVADHTLIRRVAQHDAEAFEALYDRHAVAAYALAREIVRSPQRAEDVCQEAFLTIWRSAGRYDRRRGSPRTWVLVVVRNKAIDQYRKSSRTVGREILQDGLADQQPVPAEQQTDALAFLRIEAAAVERLMRMLSDDQRRVIELSFYGGRSHGEIAEQLHLPLGTVKARARRGLRRMRATVTTRAADGTTSPRSARTPRAPSRAVSTARRPPRSARQPVR